MVLPFMMLYLTGKRGFSISKAGFVLGVYGIGAIFGSYSGGKITDKIGFYKVQVFTLFTGGVLFIILGFLEKYEWIVLCSFIIGLVNEAFRPANTAAMAQYSKVENRTRSFSLMRLSFNLGWALGGGLGGWIASYSYHLLFWIDGVTNICAAIILINVLPYKNYIKLKKESSEQIRPDIVQSPLKDTIFIKMVLITIIYISCFFQMFTNLSAYFKTELQFSERYIGALLAWNGLLIVAFEMVLVFWLERHWSQRKSIIVGLAMHIFAYAIMLVFTVDKFIAFLVITGITISEMFAFAMLMSFWISRTNEFNRGQYAGIWTMSWAISQSIGPFLGSVIADYAGFNYLWFSVSIFSLLSLFLYARLLKT